MVCGSVLTLWVMAEGEVGAMWYVVFEAFLLVFLLGEMAIRLYLSGFAAYWKDPGNINDVAIMFMGTIGAQVVPNDYIMYLHLAIGILLFCRSLYRFSKLARRIHRRNPSLPLPIIDFN